MSITMDEEIKRWTAYKIILLLKHILCFLAYQRPEAIRLLLLANATIALFMPHSDNYAFQPSLKPPHC